VATQIANRLVTNGLGTMNFSRLAQTSCHSVVLKPMSEGYGVQPLLGREMGFGGFGGLWH